MSEDVGSGEREYSRVVEYRHRHIDIDIDKTRQDKPRKKKERRFYVPEHFELTLANLEVILKREGRTLSGWIRENAESYVRLHEPGNPQQRIDVIMQLGKAYHAPSKVCGFKDCFRDAVKVAVFLPNKKTYALCEKHLVEAKQSAKLWKFLEG